MNSSRCWQYMTPPWDILEHNLPLSVRSRIVAEFFLSCLLLTIAIIRRSLLLQLQYPQLVAFSDEVVQRIGRPILSITIYSGSSCTPAITRPSYTSLAPDTTNRYSLEGIIAILYANASSMYIMRRQSPCRRVLLSILGLRSSTAAAESTVPILSASSPAQSTSNLLSFSASAETLVPTSSDPTRNILPTGDVSSAISEAQSTRAGTTASSSSLQRTSVSTRGRTRMGEARERSTEIVFMAQAVPVGYRKIGLVGALAGAAGVFLV